MMMTIIFEDYGFGMKGSFIDTGLTTADRLLTVVGMTTTNDNKIPSELCCKAFQ